MATCKTREKKLSLVPVQKLRGRSALDKFFAESDRLPMALPDEKGVLQRVIPEEVEIGFGDRKDLAKEYERVCKFKSPYMWRQFLRSVERWANEGEYDFEKRKVCMAVHWRFVNENFEKGDYGWLGELIARLVDRIARE